MKKLNLVCTNKQINMAFWGCTYDMIILDNILLLKIKTIGTSIDPENKATQVVLEKFGLNYVWKSWCGDTNQDEPYFEIILIRHTE